MRMSSHKNGDWLAHICSRKYCTFCLFSRYLYISSSGSQEIRIFRRNDHDGTIDFVRVGKRACSFGKLGMRNLFCCN